MRGGRGQIFHRNLNPNFAQIKLIISISGLVVEYIIAIDVTRARFPADAYFSAASRERVTGKRFYIRPSAKAQRTRHFARVV